MPQNIPALTNNMKPGNNTIYNDNSSKYYVVQKENLDIGGAIEVSKNGIDPIGITN